MNVFLASLLVMLVCMAAMSLGVFLSGRRLKGSCGLSDDSDDGCGCVRQRNDMCQSSDDNGDLVKIATLGNPGKGLR